MTFPDWAEPDYFTLDQICERWSDWNCSQQKLFQLCISNKIELGVDLMSTEVDDGLISGYFALPIDAIKYGHNFNNKTIETCTVYQSQNDKKKSRKKTRTKYTLPYRGTWPFNELVISKIERDRFEKRTPPSNASGTTRERNNLLRVVKVLCHKQNIDLKHPYSAAEAIIKLADNAGMKTPTINTIVNWLNDLPDD